MAERPVSVFYFYFYVFFFFTILYTLYTLVIW